MRPNKLFEFPDGSSTAHIIPRFKPATPLFAPEVPAMNLPLALSLQDMIRSSLAACDPDIRPALMNNIVVTGGTSLLPGMVTRIEQELQRDTASKVRIHAAGNGMERICGKWIGGSILGSLGSFHQLYVPLVLWELIVGGLRKRSMRSMGRTGVFFKSVVHKK